MNSAPMDKTICDAPGPVRRGEEVDAASVHAWLLENAPMLALPATPPEIRQYPDGASNLSYLLEYPRTHLVLRRPPRGVGAGPAHDMGREARVLQAIRPHWPFVPQVHAVCANSDAIGAPFYVMEHLSGLIPRAEWPAAAPLDASRARQVCRNVWHKLAALHSLDTSAPELAALGKGIGYVQRQVAGWAERLQRAHTPDAPDFRPVVEWLEAHQPKDVAICVIHNDFRLDNVVFHPSTFDVIGVLDWEMCTLGDPLMDLGSALAYWVEPTDDPHTLAMRRQPSHIPGMLTRAEIVREYLAIMAPRWNQSPDELESRFGFYEVFGLFRLAGILQQIYARHVAGRTADPRFAAFGSFVHTLHRRCLSS